MFSIRKLLEAAVPITAIKGVSFGMFEAAGNEISKLETPGGTSCVIGQALGLGPEICASMKLCGDCGTTSVTGPGVTAAFLSDIHVLEAVRTATPMRGE